MENGHLRELAGKALRRTWLTQVRVSRMSADKFLVPCEAGEVSGPGGEGRRESAAVALQRGNAMTLDKHFARSTLPLIALALAAAIPTAAFAQDENPTTPGAIPDPSTYQGSMELQRQSDQQDQQFRQQQQGQQYAPQKWRAI